MNNNIQNSVVFIPSIRFRGFSDPWHTVQLGNISKITIGEFVIKTKQNPDSPYPVYNGGTTNTGYYENFNNEGNKIVVSARGSAGYVNLIKRRYWAGNSCYSVDLSKKENDLNFIYQQMKLKQSNFINNQQTGTIPAVSKVDVNEFKINFTYPSEQSRIGTFFAHLDNLIDLSDKRINSLKSIKSSLLTKLFCNGSNLKPSIRFKGFTDTWEQCKLGEIFEFERPDNYLIKDDHYDKTGIPVLTANKAFILGYKDEKDGIYSKGDCVIFDDFTLDSKYVDFPFKVNSTVIKILTSRDKTTSLKFNYYLLQQAKILQQGHARHYISVVQPTKVNVPSKEESKKIEILFNDLDSLITLHQCKLEKLKGIKSSLLSKMFC